MNDIIECDFCESLPAEFVVGMDPRTQDDFQIVIGNLHSCPGCLAKAVNIGLRVFMECKVSKVSSKA